LIKGREIVLGVTGGIAAYKAVELVRLFIQKGADVHVVMTKNAKEFVTPLTFQTLSKNPVITEMFEVSKEVDIKHISLARRADLVLIAPASANIIGKYAHGIADDFLSTMLLATKAPIFIAPAMNPEMYQNAIVQGNIASLEKTGVKFISPGIGDTACEEIGMGRLADVKVILREIENIFDIKKDLTSQVMLVTAGPTQEPLDPVRYITNPSSGKMGYALARAGQERGAHVILISGPTHLPPPPGLTFFPITTAQEMREIVLREVAEANIVIKAAAVVDFRPKSPGKQKIKKEIFNKNELTVRLEKSPDILAEIGSRKENKILVGFAAETEALLENARKKMVAKNLDLIVANDITADGAGFGSETNKVNIIYRDGKMEELPLLSKKELAHLILDRVVDTVQSRKREE
jgi:phosphopantothenoylcysteine decarboxylase/phosphopantothenate--cysteine ligase